MINMFPIFNLKHEARICIPNNMEDCKQFKNITVKKDNVESATLCRKNKLNISGLTMRYPSVFTEHVPVFSFILLPYLSLFTYFGA